MTKYFVTAILIFISSFLFAQDEVLKSKYISNPINIDGDASEWHLPLRYYDKETKLFFDFSNDGENLFLCFQSNDNAEQKKILRSGITVTINIKGKGKSKSSIRFPVNEVVNKKNTTAANDNDTKYNFPVKDYKMQIKGFKTKDGIIPINDASGINAFMNQENKKLTYEIRIPLKELSGDDYKDDFEKALELTVEVLPLKPNYSAQKTSGIDGNEGNVENKDEENNQGRYQENSAMFEKTEFKQKFTLAKH